MKYKMEWAHWENDIRFDWETYYKYLRAHGVNVTHLLGNFFFFFFFRRTIFHMVYYNAFIYMQILKERNIYTTINY